MSLLIPAAIFLISVLLQALFAGYETGFVSINPIRVRYLAEEEESRRASLLLKYLAIPDRMITALLIGTNLSVIICTIVISTEVNQLLPDDPSGVLNTLVSTVIVAPVLLIFAEIIPKSVFRTHPNKLSLTLLPVIHVFYLIMMPIVLPVTFLVHSVLRVKKTEASTAFLTSLDDLRVLVDESVDHGAIEPDEQEMIHSILDLRTTQAKAIMAPRIHIQALPDSATRDELVALLAQTGRTRVPVYHETIDTIVGLVNAYDVILDPYPDNPDITRFFREVIHVPDTMKLRDLFQTLKEAGQHMAIVTDEYGGTDGLVTLEDILEEIFGDIEDEHDPQEKRIQRVGPNAYAVDARVPLDDLAEIMNAPVSDEEVESVGGWVMHVAGHIPAPGEVITHGRFRVTVLEGTPSRVARVRIELLPSQPATGEPLRLESTDL